MRELCELNWFWLGPNEIPPQQKNNILTYWNTQADKVVLWVNDLSQENITRDFGEIPNITINHIDALREVEETIFAEAMRLITMGAWAAAVDWLKPLAIGRPLQEGDISLRGYNEPDNYSDCVRYAVHPDNKNPFIYGTYSTERGSDADDVDEDNHIRPDIFFVNLETAAGDFFIRAVISDFATIIQDSLYISYMQTIFHSVGALTSVEVILATGMLFEESVKSIMGCWLPNGSSIFKNAYCSAEPFGTGFHNADAGRSWVTSAHEDRKPQHLDLIVFDVLPRVQQILMQRRNALEMPLLTDLLGRPSPQASSLALNPIIVAAEYEYWNSPGYQPHFFPAVRHQSSTGNVRVSSLISLNYEPGF